jgi:peptidoglycan/LPS O-acetylase OafA/YrhL
MFFFLGLYFGGFQFESYFYNFLPEVTVWEKKTFYNAIGAVLLTAAVVKGFGVQFFESKLIQFLGRISFSMYLLHFIILCSVSSYLCTYFYNSHMLPVIQLAVYLLLCLLASKLFEKYVDRPAIKISHQVSSYIVK